MHARSVIMSVDVSCGTFDYLIGHRRPRLDGSDAPGLSLLFYFILFFLFIYLFFFLLLHPEVKVK